MSHALCTLVPQSAPEKREGSVESLDFETRKVVHYILREFTGPYSKAGCVENAHMSTMRREVSQLVDKYESDVKLWLVGNCEHFRSIVLATARILFSDGVTNWCRVAALLAFGAELCLRFQGNRDECAQLVGDEISSYLLSEQRDWLLRNDKWDGFAEFFLEAVEPRKGRNAVRYTPLTVVGYVGIVLAGTVITFMMRKSFGNLM